MGIIACADEQQRKIQRRRSAWPSRADPSWPRDAAPRLWLAKRNADRRRPFRIWALIDKGAATNVVGRHLGVGPDSGRMRQQLALESDAADKDEKKSQMNIT
jgi:hypothetical protein